MYVLREIIRRKIDGEKWNAARQMRTAQQWTRRKRVAERTLRGARTRFVSLLFARSAKLFQLTRTKESRRITKRRQARSPARFFFVLHTHTHAHMTKFFYFIVISVYCSGCPKTHDCDLNNGFYERLEVDSPRKFLYRVSS